MAKVSRNDPCPCGSGQKYKKCCLDNPIPRELRGLDPATIYAFQETGFLVLEDNREQFTKGALEKFDAAKAAWQPPSD